MLDRIFVRNTVEQNIYIIIERVKLIDSLKTIGVSAGGMTITWLEWLPIVVRIAVGIATFVYLCVKTYKEIKGDTQKSSS